MNAIFEIANEDYELIAIPKSGGIGNPDRFTPAVGTISQKVKTQKNKGVFLSPYTWTVPPGGCTMPGFTHLGGGGTLTSSAQKAMAENKPIFLKLDIGQCDGSFQPPGPVAPVPCSCSIMIKEAGQTKVKGS